MTSLAPPQDLKFQIFRQICSKNFFFAVLAENPTLRGTIAQYRAQVLAGLLASRPFVTELSEFPKKRQKYWTRYAEATLKDPEALMWSAEFGEDVLDLLEE